MSYKKNIIANYASQTYAAFAGVLMVPIYISYMGAESYGLVGFFSMLQAWFSLLDVGLTPTISRETARFKSGVIDTISYRRVVYLLEFFFFTVALIGGVGLYLSSSWIATKWLVSNTILISDITSSIKLMSVIIALRWISGLYRGIITGAEKIILVSFVNILINTMRFIIIIPVLIFINSTPVIFFGFQLSVALLEAIILFLIAYTILPKIPTGPYKRWDWITLKPIIRFSLSIAFSSFIWVLVTQTDKLVLSKVINLIQYGYFTISVLVSSSITTLSSPISTAIMPRMTRLHAEGKESDLINIYRQGTRLVGILSVPLAVTLIFFSKQVLWSWTGNTNLVEETANVLSLYSAGNCILAVSAFPFYLQYAKGDLKLHLIGNIFFIIILVPPIILASIGFGMLGASWVWFFANLLYLVIWTAVVHSRFAPGFHLNWLFHDIGIPLVLVVVAAAAIKSLVNLSSDRSILALELIIIASILYIIISFSSTEIRHKISAFLLSKKK